MDGVKKNSLRTLIGWTAHRVVKTVVGSLLATAVVGGTGCESLRSERQSDWDSKSLRALSDRERPVEATGIATLEPAEPMSDPPAWTRELDEALAPAVVVDSESGVVLLATAETEVLAQDDPEAANIPDSETDPDGRLFMPPPLVAPVPGTEGDNDLRVNGDETDGFDLPDPDASGLPSPDRREQPRPFAPGALAWPTISRSIRTQYPNVIAALQERRIATGEQLVAYSVYDLGLYADSENMPEGFYDNYRQSLGAKQKLWSGGEVFGGYRIGRGSFQPWYKERQTDDAGEFKAGFRVPLLRDNRIDKYRAQVAIQSLAIDQTDPIVFAEVLAVLEDAQMTYWTWVAAGRNVEIAELLLKNATDRQELVEDLADAGKIAKIEIIDNRRLVVSRRAKLIETRQKLQETAVKLSIFNRAADGEPQVPDAWQLPPFEEPFEVAETELAEGIQEGLTERPELAILGIDRQQQTIEVAQANNLFQPALDAAMIASKDMGEFASKSMDKRPFELEAMLYFEVPLQRREARGKLLKAQGKLAQINAKEQLTRDKIVTELRAAFVAWSAAYQAYEQSVEAVELLERLEEAELDLFREGKSTILKLNIREQSTASARADVVAAIAEWHMARTRFRAAAAQLR